MGAGKSTVSKIKYFSVKFSSICEVAKTAITPDFLPEDVTHPITKEVTTKYFNKYAFVEGWIDKAEWKDTGEKYGTRFQSLRLHITDVNDFHAVLEIEMKSAGFEKFTKTWENVDFSRQVYFSAFKGQDGYTAFTIAQRDEATDELTYIKHRYTKAEPRDCPPAIFDEDDRTWDFKAQDKWLRLKVINEAIPHINEIGKARNPDIFKVRDNVAEMEDSQPRQDVFNTTAPLSSYDDDIAF